jgi:tRNA dimethylallyltransferase
LYIKAFCEGLDEVPVIPASIRSEIIYQYEQKGLGWLQNQIQLLDPLYYEKGERNNPQRMMRALEVVSYTGKSLLQYQLQQKKPRNFNIIKIGFELH